VISLSEEERRKNEWNGLAHLKKNRIEECQRIAKERGGQCLSTEYKGNKIKLKWQCKEGHEWESNYDTVVGTRRRWCPICSQGINERICRALFEALFEKPFPKRKPEWLRNEKGNKLELDGYCKELKLAFEYQGIQHYQRSNFFNKRNFEEQKKADDLKKVLCKNHDVTLIEIPYTVDPEDMGKYIRDSCEKLNIHVPHESKVDYKSLPRVFSPERLEEARELAKAKGGECLSNVYVTARKKLDWKCAKNHWFSMTTDDVKSGTWCPTCSSKQGVEKRIKYSIPFFQKFASNKKGLCLSIEYLGYGGNLLMQCEKGHQWKTTPNNLLGKKTWCPYCKGRHQTIKDMQELAKERGFKCLSTEYRGNNAKFKWQCERGHIWEAIYSNIKSNKSGCPYCSRHVKLTIEDMRETALKKGGECLSTEYTNVENKLKWRCKEGHIWEARPANIRNGQWCPICANAKKGVPLKYTINDMQDWAKAKGGECLSKDYLGSGKKLKWQCKQGHVWEAMPERIRLGQWCRICSIKNAAEKRKSTIEEMQEIAESKGGKCLSERYINSQTKLKWQCAKGHIWDAVPSSVVTRTWCPICYGNRPSTIEEMQKLAKERGGECLSKEFHGLISKL